MIFARSLVVAAIAAVALLAALPAKAAEWKPFTQADFAAAKNDGKSILVDIFAPWCPTCRAQNPIDTQKDDVRALKATSQSTLIAFKGEAETARSIGDTNPASIATLVKSAL